MISRNHLKKNDGSLGLIEVDVVVGGRLWLRSCSHRVLKVSLYKNKSGVLNGKKYDEISSFNQNDFRKGR